MSKTLHDALYEIYMDLESVINEILSVRNYQDIDELHEYLKNVATELEKVKNKLI